MQKTYDLTVRFTTDRELTEEEKGTLQLQVIAQVEEPVTAEGDDVSYSVDFYGSDIDEVKETRKSCGCETGVFACSQLHAKQMAEKEAN
jgi:hypothetical protein